MKRKKSRRWEEGADAELAERLLTRLRAGDPIWDSQFDCLFSPRYRSISDRQWSPIDAIRQAMGFIGGEPGQRILDVGSGLGKFCLAGAALAPESEFVGVEQRGPLVAEATLLANKLGLSNARFVHGDALDLEWDDFDAVYLFNPFHEQIDESEKIDDSIPTSQAIFDKSVQIVREKLEGLRQGTRIVTYYGFGGEFPRNFHLKDQVGAGAGVVEFWEAT